MATRVLDALAALPDESLHVVAGEGGERREIQFLLYAALRREQAALVATERAAASEASRILRLAQSAYRELQALLAARPTEVTDVARDGEWTLRDLLRHVIATELRYGEQVLYSATRRDDEPVRIPDDRLPCDRLAPPDPEYADSRDAETSRILELLGIARERTDDRLRDLPPDALVRPSLWGAVQIDVRERMHQIAVHLVEATLQVEKMLRQTAPPDSEARRINRRIWSARGLHERRSGATALARLDDELQRVAQLVGI